MKRWSVLVLVGAFLLVTPRGPAAVLLDADELQLYHGGGVIQWCVDPVHDVPGVDCNECVSDGNGRFVRCSDSRLDKTWLYHTGQEPAHKWDFVETDCTGVANYFTTQGCFGFVGALPCNRKFTEANLLMTDPNVECVPP